MLTWVVLLAVLGLIALGRFRIEIVALTGLLLLGIAGVAPPGIIFSGFGHPALATIIAVFFMSQGIINSGLMLGLGQTLARRTHSQSGQILSVAFAGAILSAFMNNVGAIGLMLPTAIRMSSRTRINPGSFGLLLSIASILGGAITMIGSAPNIIIASYILSSSGQSLKMFDFAPHGLAMLFTALLVWLFCKKWVMNLVTTDAGEPMVLGGSTVTLDSNVSREVIRFAPLSTRERRVTFMVILLAVLVVSLGLHPALGFGGAVLLMFYHNILRTPAAYKSIDMKIVLFLGAMLGIGQTLEYTGALQPLSAVLIIFTEGLSPLVLITLLIFVSSALSNAINNAAAAVFMAPIALEVALGGNLETTAALMAVAAGSNMTLLLPTHQATLMVMSRAPFPTTSFIRLGLVLTIFCGLMGAAVITLVWQ